MMIATRHLFYAFSVLVSATTLLALPGNASGNGCVNCHKDPIFRLHNYKLYMYYQDWLTSPHNEAEAGVTCNDCHGGDPKASDKQAAHQGVLNPSDPRSTVFFKNQPKTCGTCHEAVAAQFTKSKHYAAVNNFGAAPNCTTCHRAMNKKPYYHSIVDTTCRTCHWQQDVNSVSERMEEILRRLNISKGYMGWAALYYDSKGWPGNSRQLLDDYQKQYHDILAKGHSFNLLSSDRDSAVLLSNLKKIFEGAWEECH
ncbi:MAG: cytochrome c3 family protein, partial [Pseudomonadota bacterium]